MTESNFTWPGRIPGDPAHDLIIAYLTIDIQSSPEWTKELLHHIKLVKSGQLSTWERIGNAYCLRIYPNHIEIEADYGDEQQLNITLSDFELATQLWQKLIE